MYRIYAKQMKKMVLGWLIMNQCETNWHVCLYNYLEVIEDIAWALKDHTNSFQTIMCWVVAFYGIVYK